MIGAGPLDPRDRTQLASALTRTIDWHAGQLRKQSEIPYLNHLMQVSGLILEHGGDVDQAIAGLFHDALEDAATPAERALRERAIDSDFGVDVLRMVLDCTDTTADEAGDDKAPWRERKERYLDHLSNVPERSLLVAACDKRHNLHALVWDLRVHGLAYLDGFNAGIDEQVWYFDHLVRGFKSRVPDRLYRELSSLREELRAVANWA